MYGSKMVAVAEVRRMRSAVRRVRSLRGALVGLGWLCG